MNAVTKSRKTLIITLAAVVVAGGAWWKLRGGSAEAATVETEAVVRGNLRETISATGTLQALQTVQVGTQVSGTIDNLYVDFNTKVKRNQLLALIDPSVLDAQIESSRASLAQATARANDAAAALKEGEELLAKNYISDKDMRTLKVNVATTKAQLDAATADYNRALRNRQYAEIRSPIDGVVIERAVDRGQTVASGFQTPTLFTIAEDLTHMQIVASVDESQIGSLQVGQPAHFTVSAFPTKRFKASVKQIRLKSTVTQNVVTYAVVLGADNESGELLPGMTATVDFVLKDLTDVLRVPSAALRVQRIPDEFVDAETLKRMKERETMANERRDGAGPAAGQANDQQNRGQRQQFNAQTGASPGGRPQGMGGEGFTPEQQRAFRERMAQGGQGGFGGGGAFGNLWIMGADGKAKRMPVRILGSDMQATAVELLRSDDATSLKEGDKVIVRVVNAPATQQNATRSILPGGGGNQQQPGRFR
jgi:HlyD family secretion protein